MQFVFEKEIKNENITRAEARRIFSSKWPKNPTFFSQHSKTMNKKENKQVTLNGMMTFGKTDDGERLLDFTATEYAEMTPFVANCKVQAMRDGNVYITERPRRKKGTPLFREDNCTFSLGHDGRYYFVFTMEKREVKRLPKALVHQALAIAQKVSVKFTV